MTESLVINCFHQVNVDTWLSDISSVRLSDGSQLDYEYSINVDDVQ